MADTNKFNGTTADAIRAMVETLAQQADAWLLTIFGDMETAKAMKHLFILHVHPMESRMDADGRLIVTQRWELKHR